MRYVDITMELASTIFASKLIVANNRKLNCMKNILFLLILLTSCVSNENYCEKKGTAILVGYKVAKHSHIFIKILETNTVHEIGGMGGRREPNIALGTKFVVKYRINNKGNVYPLLNASDYAKQPIDRTSRYVMMTGYEKYGGN